MSIVMHRRRHNLKQFRLVLDDPSEAIRQGVRGLFRRAGLSALETNRFVKTCSHRTRAPISTRITTAENWLSD
jgi:hypothetical protein